MSSKLKYHATWLATAVFVFITYQLAIKKTIVQYRLYKDASIKVKAMQQAPQLLAKYEQELNNLSDVIGKNITDYTMIDGDFFSLVSTLASQHKLLISSLETPIVQSKQGYQMKLFPVKLKGSFVAVLSMVEKLEENTSLGRIVSMKLNVVNDKNKKKQLESTLYYKIVSHEDK